MTTLTKTSAIYTDLGQLDQYRESSPISDRLRRTLTTLIYQNEPDRDRREILIDSLDELSEFEARQMAKDLSA